MKKQFYLVVCFVAFTLFFISGCAAKDPLVGSWVLTNDDEMFNDYTFYPDGTFESYGAIFDKSKLTDTYSRTVVGNNFFHSVGKYVIDGDKVALIIDGYDSNFTFKKTGDELEWKSEKGKEFKYAKSSSFDNQLIGKWELDYDYYKGIDTEGDMSTVVMNFQFLDNNFCLLDTNGNSGIATRSYCNYELSNKTLTITFQDGVLMKVLCEQDDNSLGLTFDGGINPIKLIKIDDDKTFQHQPIE